MGERKEKKPIKRICAGLLAHVDAGKTTFGEPALPAEPFRNRGASIKGQLSGHHVFGAAAWDYHSSGSHEVARCKVTLLDTPGHVDFSAEMERLLQVWTMRSW